MFTITSDKTICLTRGDAANIMVSAKTPDKENYTFKNGDEIRFRILKKKDCSSVILQKSVLPAEDMDSVCISLSKDDTKIGDIINKPVEYWYEIELNPNTVPQTIVGYDDDGPKIFRLYPEGSDIE